MSCRQTRASRFARQAAAAFLAATAFGGIPVVAARAQSTMTFDVRTDPRFAPPETILARYVRASGQAAKDNRLCVLGEQAADGERRAWVVWRRAHRIVLWEAGNDDLSQSRRILDQRKDVVASEKDLQGSSYRVTRAWVEQLSARCARDGAHLDIRLSHIP
jgi:hypothetical protein